jgi:phosphoribosyl 1,2-cyclic phosphodiesterase
MAHDLHGPMTPGAALPAVASGASASTMRVTCWGTRGSIPTPGRETAEFGGNTSCVEVRPAPGWRLIFDAGTGIRLLGRRLVDEPSSTEADLFLTHFHWDHIQGLPFFAPLYDPTTTIRVHGPRQGDQDVQTLFAAQMSQSFFPLPYEALAATLEFRDVDGVPWSRNGVRVDGFRLRHPGSTYGYRIRSGALTVAYLPDNELVGGDYPTDAGWYDRLVEFLGGADLLLHDAMFTEAEYPSRTGWGHSTFEQALRLARDAGVRRLQFFHHSPDRTDDELHAILDDMRTDLARHAVPIELGVAMEGEELQVQEQAP